mgnify:CR=1 FL=1
MTPTARSPIRSWILAISWVVVGVTSVSSPSDAFAQGPMSRSARAARLVERATRLEAAGHVPGAVGTFREAVQVDPSFAPAYVGLVRLHLARGEIGAALEAARVGRRRRPDDVALGLAEIDALVAAGRDEEALASSLALTRFAPRSVEVWWSEGSLARERGRFVRALSAYRRMVRLGEEGVAIEPARVDEARQLASALAMLVGDLDLARIHCDASEVRAALCE